MYMYSICNYLHICIEYCFFNNYIFDNIYTINK